MLSYIRAESLISLGLIVSTDYDTLVSYIEGTAPHNPDTLMYINMVPDRYIKNSDIFWVCEDNVELLEVLVKKICAEELISLHEHLCDNPCDEPDRQVTLLTVIMKELNITTTDDPNLASICGMKLSDFDIDYPMELTQEALTYFVDDVYEPNQLLNLIRLVANNTVNHDICTSILNYMMEEKFLITAEDVMWEEVNIVNEFVFRCIQTDADLIYKPEFAYLVGYMDKNLPYYMLRYGNHMLTGEDILNEVEDFSLMINQWQQSDIFECYMFDDLIAELTSIDTKLLDKVKEHGIGFKCNSTLERLIGYEDAKQGITSDYGYETPLSEEDDDI